MATRLGIELSSAACRLIEIEGRLRPGAEGGEPRVRSFAVLPPAGPDTEAMLASLKGRAAAVVVWGAPAEHRQVVVTAGSYESMRREAVSALASLGVQTHAALADIAPVRGQEGKRRPIVAALAAAEPMLDAVGLLRAAGIRVRSLGTPAMALASMAFVRRGLATEGAVDAYVAIEETSTCIALIRDGALAIAHELPWGYITTGALRPREDIAARLATELQQYFDAVGAPAAAQVCICGGLPDLRTVSAMLTERLDLEVEPLDSLFGIDATQLPEPSTDFRERVAELRLAWAAAADWPPHLNLLRARRRQQSRRALATAAIVAGVVAGVGGAWRLARSDIFPASAAPKQTAAASAKQAPPPASQRAAALPRQPPSPAPQRAAAPTPPPVSPAPAPKVGVPPPPPPTPPRPTLATRSTVPRGSTIAALVRPPQAMLTPALVTSLRRPETLAPPPAIVARVPPPTPVTPKAPEARPIPPPPPVIARQQPAPPIARKPESQAAPAASVSDTPKAAEAPPPLKVPKAPELPRAVRVPKPEPVIPFDASLETILYSSDRKLAIIDGRIVGVGDVVRGARIVEISPTTVMLRDGEGRLRRLALGAAKP